MTAAFLLDLGRCIGCQACVVACKAGNELVEGTQFIHIGEQVSGTFPALTGRIENRRCLHCADAACIAVCTTGALFKDGALTRLDRGACSGCGYCVESCPYGVPVMVEGRSSKCDACAATTAAGGEPWCVTTCPSRALEFSEREDILAEANRRVVAMQARYPRAQVYGETRAGGLGVILVLPDDPEALGLPRDPEPPLVAKAWQRLVQPGAIGLTGLTVAAATVAAVIARRNHMAELNAIEATETSAASGGTTTEET